MGDLETEGRRVPRCLVIQFPTVEALRAAMNAGACAFRLFEGSPESDQADDQEDWP